MPLLPRRGRVAVGGMYVAAGVAAGVTAGLLRYALPAMVRAVDAAASDLGSLALAVLRDATAPARLAGPARERPPSPDGPGPTLGPLPSLTCALFKTGPVRGRGGEASPPAPARPTSAPAACTAGVSPPPRTPGGTYRGGRYWPAPGGGPTTPVRTPTSRDSEMVEVLKAKLAGLPERPSTPRSPVDPQIPANYSGARPPRYIAPSRRSR